MRDTIAKLKKEAMEELKAVSESEALFRLKKKYLGRNGAISRLFKGLKEFEENERREIGGFANAVAKELERAINDAESIFSPKKKKVSASDFFDFSIAGAKRERGGIHPVTQILHKAQDIFLSMGFEVASGPEVETQTFNFDLLNFQRDHPARDMQDTFHLESGVAQDGGPVINLAPELVLRTHTSSVQLRSMLERTPPVRLVAPGRCFRYEATDASHETTFHQLECLVIDKEVSMRHLITTLKKFLEALFEMPLSIRVRPSYFPFVEPGIEVDIGCFLCEQKGCSVCKKRGWLEIAGAGMVHPNVLKNMKADPNEWLGFAFGMGFERVMMLYFGVNDIRLVYSGDVRFLRQF